MKVVILKEMNINMFDRFFLYLGFLIEALDIKCIIDKN